MAENDKFTGVLTEEPLRAEELGAGINFAPTAFSMSGLNEGLHYAANPDFFDGAVLAVLFGQGEERRVLGSAVLVAPGIALGAWHVFEDYIDDAVTGKVGVLLYGITKMGQLQLWKLRKAVNPSGTDIAILSLEGCSKIPENRTYTQSIITTRQPTVGEELFVCGIRPGKVGYTSEEVIDFRLHISSGNVKSCYPPDRSSALLKVAHVEFDAYLAGSMSGGPVFDRNGLLIGIGSASQDPNLTLTYASSVWPALGTLVEHVWPPGIITEPTRLLEFDNRICAIDRREALLAKRSADGSGQTLTYTPW